MSEHLTETEILEYVELMQKESDTKDSQLKFKVEDHINNCKHCRDTLEAFEKKIFFNFKYGLDSTTVIDSREVYEEEDSDLPNDIYSPKRVAEESAEECIRENNIEMAVFHLKDYFEWLAVEDDIESDAYRKAYEKYCNHPIFLKHLIGVVQKPAITANALETILGSIKNYIVQIKQVGRNIITSYENGTRLTLGLVRGTSAQERNFDIFSDNGRTIIEIDSDEKNINFMPVLLDEEKNEFPAKISFKDCKILFDFGKLPVNKRYKIDIRSME